MVDSTQAIPDFPASLAKILTDNRVFIALNKSDLCQGQARGDLPDAVPHCQVSALTGEGMDTLKTELQLLLEKDLLLPVADQITVSARHAHALQQTQAALAASLDKLRHKEPTELAVSDLREALHSLGTVIGSVDNEAVLDRIFAAFCIGK